MHHCHRTSYTFPAAMTDLYVLQIEATVQGNIGFKGTLSHRDTYSGS